MDTVLLIWRTCSVLRIAIQEDNNKLIRKSVWYARVYPSSMLFLLADRDLADRGLISTSHGEESVSRVWAIASFAKVVVTSIVPRTRACHVSSISVVTPPTKDPSTLRSPIMR